MEHHELLKDLLILFGFATLVALILHRVRQSIIVAYLLTGILVGPYCLRLITNREAIELMAEIGVVLLLFTIGLEFSLGKLLRMRQVVLGAGSRQVGLTIFLTVGATLLVGYPWRQSVFWGFLIAASSTAIVLKLLLQRQELDSPHGQVILGILLFQDLFVIPMMAILPALTVSSTSLAFSILFALAKAMAVLGLVFLISRYVFPLLGTASHWCATRRFPHLHHLFQPGYGLALFHAGTLAGIGRIFGWTGSFRIRVCPSDSLGDPAL